MKEYIQDLKKEFANYNAKLLLRDLMAGITVAAVALPLALAFAVSCGASAAAGLITAIVSGLVIATLGGAFYQISGPTGTMAAVLMSVIATHGMGGVFLATLMAGVIRILCGIFKVGKLTTFIPMPVITGFTSGIAVIIALGQIDNILGVKSVGVSPIEKIGSYFTLGIAPNITAILIGVGVILLMVFYPKKWNAVVPSSLVAVVIFTAINIIFPLNVENVGTIPNSLLLDERLRLEDINLDNIKSLISPAISIAALGMIETLLCGSSAGRMTGVKLSSNRELVAQGIGNIISPIFGGIPSTAAIARTSVAIKSGAVTRLCAIFHSLFILTFMLLLGPVMEKIPLSALAGVLIVTAWRMNEWSAIKYIFSRKFKGGITKFLVTMMATIVFDLTVAILIGVGVALVLTLAKVSKLESDIDDDDRANLYLRGSVIFSTTNDIEELLPVLRKKESINIDMSGVSVMDISGAKEILELCEDMAAHGVEVSVTQTSPTVETMLCRGGVREFLNK